MELATSGSLSAASSCGHMKVKIVRHTSRCCRRGFFMTSRKNDDQRSSVASPGFRHQRRPLGTGEGLPPKVDLVTQIIALSDGVKRLRAQTPSEPEQSTDEQDEENLDADT